MTRRLQPELAKASIWRPEPMSKRSSMRFTLWKEEDGKSLCKR